MIAYLSSLPQPMTPERSSLYARTLGETSSWSDVAVVEAREIISQSEPSTSHLAGCLQVHPYPASRILSGSRPGSLVGNAGLALAESLAHFLTLDLQ